MFLHARNSRLQEARHNPKSRIGTFYLLGALKLLDAPGQWFYDESSGMLYLWAPQNANPNEHTVDPKSRLLGLDLKNRSWIWVDGIDLLGCSLDLDMADHCLIKGMRARHISHTRGGNTISSIGEKSGIHISGHHNRLETCEISHSAGNGVSRALLSQGQRTPVLSWLH